MAFPGHTLVWHNQTPAGFFRDGYADDGALLPKEAMAERMKNYIYEVVRLLHAGWPRLLVAMDVVNEAVYDNGASRTSNSYWYAVFGDDSRAPGLDRGPGPPPEAAPRQSADRPMETVPPRRLGYREM